MYCLYVVGMVVSPRSSHPFASFVIRNNVHVVREFLKADSEFLILLDNLSVEWLPHLSSYEHQMISATSDLQLIW